MESKAVRTAALATFPDGVATGVLPRGTNGTRGRVLYLDAKHTSRWRTEGV